MNKQSQVRFHRISIRDIKNAEVIQLCHWYWPTLTSRGQPLFLAIAPISDTGWARSGVNGPLMWGFNYLRRKETRLNEEPVIYVMCWCAKAELCDTFCITGLTSGSVLTNLAQVNLNHLVVFTVRVWDQVIFELFSHRGNLWEGRMSEATLESRRGELRVNAQTQRKIQTSTAGFLQVCPHAMVVGENRCGGSNLSTHVTDGGHSWQIKESF